MFKSLGKELVNCGEKYLLPLLFIYIFWFSLSSGNEILSLPGNITVNRIILLLFPAIIGLASLGALILSIIRKPMVDSRISTITGNAKQVESINLYLPVAWLVLLVISFLTPGILGSRWPIYVRIDPLLRLAFVTVSAAWIFWLFKTRKPRNGLSEWDWQPWAAGLLLGSLIIIFCLLVGITGKGIGVGTQYWGKSGVPFLHWQMGLSWILMLVWLRVNGGKKDQIPWLQDVILFTILWLTAFYIWKGIPTPISRYVTAAYPPNYANYPFSDAGDYMLQAQAIWTGNGFSFGFIDKPLHLTFLSILSLIAGADYSRMILFQVGVLAIMPGLVYLIAAKLHSRLSGIFAGLSVIFMQSNNLAISSSIQATNVKMTMSESLTAMLLMVLCLCIINWWKNPRSLLAYPALAGTILGLNGLVRLNGLVILPFILIAWIVINGIKRKTTWISALIFVLFCILPFAPWALRNKIVYDDPFRSFSSKTMGVIFKHRINPVLNDTGDMVPSPEADDSDVNAVAPAQTTLEVLLNQFIHTGFHNLVAVGLSLPASPYHTTLDETIRLPYWDQEWDGGFTQNGQLTLAINMAIVVAGFSFGWKKSRSVSIVPLIILGGYLIANTASLVSGGRYIIPVDWIVPFYFSIGITGLTLWLFDLESVQQPDRIVENNLWKTGAWLWSYIGLALVIACLPTVLSLSIPKRYLPADNTAVMNEMRKMHLNLPAAISSAELEKFVSNKEASFKLGMAMFPRWMKTGEGDTGGNGSAFSAMPYDHLSFSVISSGKGPFDVVLPINEPVRYFPNASDVILIGCQTNSFFNAAVVVLRTPQPVVLVRPDIKRLECPLPQP